MRRLHFFEIEDQPWCPRAVRDGVTDFLELMADRGRIYASIVPILEAAIRQTGRTAITDMGAGGGGPWRSLLDALEQRGIETRVTLTDMHPNVAAFERAARESGGRITGHRQPVDATAVPSSLPGFRTMFAAFHHFQPDQARAVLADAVHRGDPVAIIEPMHRSTRAMAITCLTPLFVLLATPGLRPFRWSRLLLTYLLPVIPFVVLHDGLVSCLRTYTPDELLAMARQADHADRYEWRAAESGDGPIPVTWLTGVPHPSPKADASVNGNHVDDAPEARLG